MFLKGETIHASYPSIISRLLSQNYYHVHFVAPALSHVNNRDRPPCRQHSRPSYPVVASLQPHQQTPPSTCWVFAGGVPHVVQISSPRLCKAYSICKTLLSQGLRQSVPACLLPLSHYGRKNLTQRRISSAAASYCQGFGLWRVNPRE